MKHLKIIILLIAGFGLSSCLKYNLDKLPIYQESKIENIYLEHRYYVQDKWQGEQVVRGEEITNPDNVFVRDTNALTITKIFTISTTDKPAVGWIAAERAKITLTNIVLYLDLSLAAKVAPVDGAPALGKPGDFSVPRKYRVTAADGSSSVWTVTVVLTPLAP